MARLFSTGTEGASSSESHNASKPETNATSPEVETLRRELGEKEHKLKETRVRDYDYAIE